MIEFIHCRYDVRLTLFIFNYFFAFNLNIICTVKGLKAGIVMSRIYTDFKDFLKYKENLLYSILSTAEMLKIN